LAQAAGGIPERLSAIAFASMTVARGWYFESCGKFDKLMLNMLASGRNGDYHSEFVRILRDCDSSAWLVESVHASSL